jgi:hypothetical protein
MRRALIWGCLGRGINGGRCAVGMSIINIDAIVQVLLFFVKMPQLQISVQDEQKAFEADVAAIEKQWSSTRQAHLKRYV